MQEICVPSQWARWTSSENELDNILHAPERDFGFESQPAPRAGVKMLLPEDNLLGFYIDAMHELVYGQPCSSEVGSRIIAWVSASRLPILSIWWSPAYLERWKRQLQTSMSDV
jgi:hypothetical protein